MQADPVTLADALPAAAWTPHAAGEGSKGIRLYDWARIALPWTVDAGLERWCYGHQREEPSCSLGQLGDDAISSAPPKRIGDAMKRNCSTRPRANP